MSSGERTKWQDAKKIAESFLLHVDDVMAWHCVAGSIRRETATVGDIEIVVRPQLTVAFLNRLDVLVDSGVIRKAVYGKTRAHRWGEHYRGMVYRGKLVEVFLCDENNQGFIQWLRTGDGLKNTYVMSCLKQCSAPVRFDGGYGWHVSYTKSHADYDSGKGYAKLGKLIIPDEFTMYMLLGMKPIVPQHRVTTVYRKHLEPWVKCPEADVLEAMTVPVLKQKRLF